MLYLLQGTVQARALINSSGQSLFLSKHFAKANLLKSNTLPVRVKALDGHRISLYGRHELRITATNYKEVAQIYNYIFYLIDIEHYNIVLGYL